MMTAEIPQTARVGDILTLAGRRYRLTKKTTTAVAVERYYWFDAVIDFIGRKIGN